MALPNGDTDNGDIGMERLLSIIAETADDAKALRISRRLGPACPEHGVAQVGASRLAHVLHLHNAD
jgi:hypothetical protein